MTRQLNDRSMINQTNVTNLTVVLAAIVFGYILGRWQTEAHMIQTLRNKQGAIL